MGFPWAKTGYMLSERVGVSSSGTEKRGIGLGGYSVSSINILREP